MRGAGDLIAAGLEAVGITKQRADLFARQLGLKGCGCEQRQDWWNAVIPFGRPETARRQLVIIGTAGRPDRYLEAIAGSGPVDHVVTGPPVPGFSGLLIPSGPSCWEQLQAVSVSEQIGRTFLVVDCSDPDREATHRFLESVGFRPPNTEQPVVAEMERDNLRYLLGMFPAVEICWTTAYRAVFAPE